MTSDERIREIIEFVTVDAYGDYEVMSGWGVALDDAIDLPFSAKALGVDVTVYGFDSDPQHGLRCEIQREGTPRRWVGTDTLDVETVPDSVREVFDAYDAWAKGSY